MTERIIDDLDLDNDIIAGLLDKLTLETRIASLFPDEVFNNADEVFNILQSLEKTVPVNVEDKITVKPANDIISENCNNSSTSLKLEKDYFLSLIGLVPHKLFEGSNNVVPSSKTLSSAKNVPNNPDSVISCENFTFTPFNFPKMSNEETDLKSLDFLHEVFQAKRQVSVEGSRGNSLNDDDDRSSLFLTNGDAWNDDKSLSSPDSGFHDAFPYVFSPEEESLSSDNSVLDLDDVTDEKLQQFLLTFSEYESLCSREAAVVPSLKDDKNPDEHIEKIVDFLRQPVSQEETLDEIETLNLEDYVPSRLSKEAMSVLSTRSPKSRKLNCRLKYTLENDEQLLHHSPMFSEIKNNFQNSQILKQIQSEHIQKRIKVMQKKLKRTAADDRENKRQRIMYKDSTLINEE